ncbi:MAG: helix-hairpin-helix domain-containing protein [Aquificae bacterium]|nr:helix-hairpin-helix domain-containing protein [Aquificota bacterium]
MVEKYFNPRLWEKQKLVLSVFFFFFLLFKFFPFYEEKPKYSPEDLKININTASKEELLLVPYIGKKTAEKILKLREEKGVLTEEDIKKIRFFKKFKIYITF